MGWKNPDPTRDAGRAHGPRYTLPPMQDMHRNRIASILKQHAVLFGSDLVSLDPWVREEIAEPVAVLDDPT
jgi:hypothetical protein